MRQLAIDMGNTRVKVGVFSGEKLIRVLEGIEPEAIPNLVHHEEIERVIISSVVADFSDIREQIDLKDVIRLTPELDIPIKNCYGSPATLGMDRLAGVIGANHLHKQTDCLVIDAGTTITYDLIDREGQYLGGGISPGMRVRFKSLNQHTSQLPLLTADSDKVPLIGNDTKGSIMSGVLNGITAEIEGIIRRYGHKFPTLKVILCGGDAGIFESKLKTPVSVVSHLVLIGLNSVLLYHAQNK